MHRLPMAIQTVDDWPPAKRSGVAHFAAEPGLPRLKAASARRWHPPPAHKVA